MVVNLVVELGHVVGAQHPKMLSSLFYVDMHLHHDVRVQY